MRAALIALCAAALAAPAGAQLAPGAAARDSAAGAHDSLYATPALRALVAAAARRNAVPPALDWYEARVETEIGVVSRRPDGAEGVAAVEQVGTTLRWARDGRYEQRVLGYRTQQVAINLSVLGVLGSGWVTPVLYGNRLLFRGVTEADSGAEGARRRRARRDTLLLVHPLAEDREPVYRYRGGDTVLVLRLGGRDVPIVRVQVEPTGAGTRRTGVFAGEIDLDASRSQVVRMRGRFGVVGGRRGWRDRLPAPVQAVAFVEYVNAEFDGAYWLPSYQRVELQAAVPAMGEGRAVLRIVSRLRDHRINQPAFSFTPGLAFADTTAGRRRRRPLTWAPRDSVADYAEWRAALGAATADVHADDFADVGPDRWRATGAPRVELGAERASDVFHFNRVEGAFTGAGVVARLRDLAPGVTLRATGGWAWSERTVRGRVQGEWLRGAWQLAARAGRLLDLTNDFRAPFDSGSTVGALVFSMDEYDYVDRRLATVTLTRQLGGDARAADGVPERGGARRTALLRAEAGVVSDRPAVTRLTRGLLRGDSVFRANRGVDPGRYVRTAASLAYHPDVAAELVRPGVGALLSYERGDGRLRWQRIEARLVGRQSWRQLTYVARVDGGAVMSRRPPPQQLFELGESQGLPGYDYKAFAGDRAVLARALAMYATPYWRAPLRVGRRWVLPGLAPALTAGVQAGWTRASDAAALAAIARLGVRTSTATGALEPISRPTEGVRASVNAGVRFFGGAVFVGAARRVDRGAAWRASVTLAQQL